MASRSFDLVVFGATGVTGRQVLRHLHQRAAEHGIKWAIAGRDQERLRASLDEIGADAATLHADLDDHEAVSAVVQDTVAVASLVGPYSRNGDVVYRTCARYGTHQIDVCGEIDWLSDRATTVDREARRSGACIVHTAGFEALPFDLLALLAAETMATRWQEPLADVDVAITVERDPPIMRPADLVSGGTFASGIEALRRGTHPAMSDTRILDPAPHAPQPFALEPRRHEGTGRWIGPLLPSPHINPAVAQHTAALVRRERSGLFAPDYRFREGLVGAGLWPAVSEEIAARWLSMTQTAGSVMSSAPGGWRSIVADIASSLGPSVGDGPSEERMTGWAWQLDARATSSRGRVLDCVARGSGHPGYRSTGNVVAEAALMLATGEARPGGGLLTPAYAFGVESIERFEHAGVTIQVT